jgi:nitroimidazol reductase NimA-like FMN-containing flavoprotein (pyridoxamine 5'-phosphate oxidase superfamily)
MVDSHRWTARASQIKWPEQAATITGGQLIMSIKVARFLDVAEGLQPKQFSVGSHEEITSLSELDDSYKLLLDRPIACVLGLIGNDGRVNQTPMWFDYEGDVVLVNVAAQRKKIEWIRARPELSILILNPENMYHWLSIKCTVTREILEDDPVEGARVTAQLDRIWTKYTSNEPPYGLRDPSINERRVLFECRVDRIATFGKP